MERVRVRIKLPRADGVHRQAQHEREWKNQKILTTIERFYPVHSPLKLRRTPCSRRDKE
jgi:hypothetical protein